MERTVATEMVPLANINPADLDDEGCVRLACEIAKIVAEQYRYHYAEYIISCKSGDDVAIREARADMRSSERNLKDSIFNLTDDQISSLQMQAEEHEQILYIKKGVQRLYQMRSRDGVTKKEFIKSLNIDPAITKRWLS